MPLRPCSLLLLGACAPDVAAFTPRPYLRDLVVAQGGTERSLDSDMFVFGPVSSPDGTCEPVTHLDSLGSDLGLFFDLTSYASGAALVSPDPPLQPKPGRFPQLNLLEDPLPVWSGGTGQLTVDLATHDHEITWEGPVACPWIDADLAECEPLGTVTVRFTADLYELVYCSTGHPGAEMAPSGLPYCVTNSDFERCGGTWTGDDVILL